MKKKTRFEFWVDYAVIPSSQFVLLKNADAVVEKAYEKNKEKPAAIFAQVYVLPGTQEIKIVGDVISPDQVAAIQAILKANSKSQYKRITAQAESDLRMQSEENSA